MGQAGCLAGQQSNTHSFYAMPVSLWVLRQQGEQNSPRSWPSELPTVNGQESGESMRREAGAKWQEASGKRQEPTVGKSRKACARHNYEAIRRNYYLGHPTQGAGGVFGAGADAGAGAPWNIWPVLGPLVRPFGGRAKRMRTSLSFMVQRTRAAE